MDFKSLLAALRDEVKLATTEDDITHMTRAITALRDFAEHKRREIVQVRLNQENLNKALQNTDNSNKELKKYINVE